MYTSLFCFSEQHWPECSYTPGFALIKSFPRFLFVSFIAIEFSDWGKSWFPFQSRRLGPSDTCGDMGEEQTGFPVCLSLLGSILLIPGTFDLGQSEKSGSLEAWLFIATYRRF